MGRGRFDIGKKRGIAAVQEQPSAPLGTGRAASGYVLQAADAAQGSADVA